MKHSNYYLLTTVLVILSIRSLFFGDNASFCNAAEQVDIRPYVSPFEGVRNPPHDEISRHALNAAAYYRANFIKALSSDDLQAARAYLKNYRRVISIHYGVFNQLEYDLAQFRTHMDAGAVARLKSILPNTLAEATAIAGYNLADLAENPQTNSSMPVVAQSDLRDEWVGEYRGTCKLTGGSSSINSSILVLTIRKGEHLLVSYRSDLDHYVTVTLPKISEETKELSLSQDAIIVKQSVGNPRELIGERVKTQIGAEILAGNFVLYTLTLDGKPAISLNIESFSVQKSE